MPVTARLSRRFYETFGDEIANELVEWFNQVDATYRADLRELNELNFARFDAKLEQRVVELKAEIEGHVAALDAKIERVVAALRAEIEGRIAALDAKVEQRTAELKAELRAGLAEQNVCLARQRADLMKWMFIFWAGTVVPLGGLMVALLQG